jgi:glutamate carboxypeptidase
MNKAAKNNLPRIDAEEILAGIREWVEVETPSNDGAAVNKLVDNVERQLRDVGQKIERVPGAAGFGDVLIGRSPWGEGDKGILVVAHLDTVHPHGSLAGPMKWRREGDVVFGPGIYDMKAGGHMAYYAYRHLVRLGRTTKLPITFLFVPEEEVGSPTSREIIEREARRSKYALVLEPARDGGKIVLARKGTVIMKLRTRGRASHAGVRHQDGRSAIKEMAHQILALEAMTDYETGLTVSVGTIAGGTGTNVVPAECEVTLDMRIPSAELVEECLARVRTLKVKDPDVTLEVEGGLNRPPYETNDGIRALYEHARGLAAEIGFDLQGVKTGGGSDGNFTAALGIPTLDGLGADGKGAHAIDEQIYVSSLEPRTQLLVRLFETLR